VLGWRRIESQQAHRVADDASRCSKCDHRAGGDQEALGLAIQIPSRPISPATFIGPFIVVVRCWSRSHPNAAVVPTARPLTSLRFRGWHRHSPMAAFCPPVPMSHGCRHLPQFSKVPLSIRMRYSALRRLITRDSTDSRPVDHHFRADQAAPLRLTHPHARRCG